MTGGHTSHWGAFTPDVDGRGEVTAVHPTPLDPAPSPILQNLVGSLRHRLRVPQPMVREGWLRHGPGPDHRRGEDRFVPVGWDEVLDRLAAELRRVYDGRGPEAVFGGSYGWSSAGRFHHAQGQVHRFLGALGGYVRSVNTCSAGTAEVLLPTDLASSPGGPASRARERPRTRAPDATRNRSRSRGRWATPRPRGARGC